MKTMSEKICGECQYSMYRAYEKDFCCANEDSDYYTEEVGYTDGCDEWSPKGVEI